jgi:serine/threonine protein kinase
VSPETRTVGRYELLGVIGVGGMSVVHLARQLGLDRFVAIKELASFDVADPDLARQFLREARLAGSLSHPNVVTVLDYIEQDGVPYISMEYLRRGSLRELIPHLKTAHVVGVLVAVLAGLEAAEARQIVHRDLKPENFMVTENGSVKIADFGIAKAATEVTTPEMRTATGTTIGTPSYMAPEQAMGKAVTAATDLYSLGAVAYELLVGRRPFDGEPRVAPAVVLTRHVNEPLTPPRSVRPDLDPDLAGWISQLLEKDPSDRPTAAGTAAEALEDIAIRLLGPRWRRDAALPELARASTAQEAAQPIALVSGRYVTVGPPAPDPPRTSEEIPLEPQAVDAGPDVHSHDVGPAPVQTDSDDGVGRPPTEPDGMEGRSSPPGHAATLPPSRPATVAGAIATPSRPGVRRPLWWATLVVLSAAVAAVAAVLVREATQTTGTPATTPGHGRVTDLKRFRPGPDYSVDPPRGWECAQVKCKEARDAKGSFVRVDFQQGPAKLSILRYPLDAVRQDWTSRAVFSGTVTKALHRTLGPSVPVQERDGSLGSRSTWEYTARSKQEFAAGTTFVAAPNGYWIACIGASSVPLKTLKSYVRAFASSLRPVPDQRQVPKRTRYRHR